MGIIAKFFDKMLRKQLVMYAGFSLDEVPMVKKYIDGDDNALKDLLVYRTTREKEISNALNEQYTTTYTTTDNSVTNANSTAPSTSIIN